MTPAALASLARHMFTSLGSVAVWLAARHLISPDQTTVVAQAFGSLVDPLSIITGAILSRGVIWLAAIAFGKPGISGTVSCCLGFATAAPLLHGLLSACAAVVLVLTLPSCSTAQLSEYQAITNAVPVTIGANYNGLTAVYSTRTGVSLIYDAAGKAVGTVALPSAPVPVTSAGKPVFPTK